jgi:hypothetical protein
MASAPLERLSDRAFRTAEGPGNAKREAEPKRGVMKGERCRAVPAGASDEAKILNITGRAGAGEGGFPMTGADEYGAKPMDRTVRWWLRQIIDCAVEPEMAGRTSLCISFLTSFLQYEVTSAVVVFLPLAVLAFCERAYAIRAFTAACGGQAPKRNLRLISILSAAAISPSGKTRSRVLCRDCPSTSCPLHCSNVHVRQGCGIGCRRVQDRRTFSKVDHEPGRLRADNCRHSQYPEDRAIRRSENRSQRNRSLRRQVT